MSAPRTPFLFVLSVVFVSLIGCGRGELPRKIVFGTVTLGGENVARGTLRFVPVEETQGPSSSARIVDGQYSIKQHSGVPLGKHRVEVDAQRLTGQTTLDRISGQSIEKTLSIGPKVYAGAQSPLIVEVTDDGDGRIDLVIP